MSNLIVTHPPSFYLVSRNAVYEFEKGVFRAYFLCGFHSTGEITNYLSDNIAEFLFQKDQSTYMSYLEEETEEIDEGLIVSDYINDFEADVITLLDYHNMFYHTNIKSPFDQLPAVNNIPCLPVW